MSRAVKIVFRLLRNKVIISYLTGYAVVLILYLVTIIYAKILAPSILATLLITLLILFIGLSVSLIILAIYYVLVSILALRRRKRQIFSITDEETSVLDSKNILRLFSRKTEEDTLIAVSEWIHRNIRFWYERYYLATWFYIALAILVLLSTVIGRLARQDNFEIYLVIILALSVIVIIFVYSQLLPYTRTYGRDFLEMLTLMLKDILTISEILSLRLAICKDYARFTAAVLLKLYPGKPIYIITIPRHAACAIGFSGKTYVLDQKLPIMTLNGWRRYWCKEFGSRATMEVYRLEREVIDDKVYFVPKLIKRQKLCIDHNISIEPILNKLSMKLSNNFTMKHTTKNIREGQVNYYEQDIRILNCIEVLDDDELVVKSLYKLVLLKLESELLDKTSSVIELKPYICSNNALCIKAIIASEDRT